MSGFVREGERWTVEYGFEKLLVWQKAIELVRLVYEVSKTFPSGERYALTDQLRRAVVSIPSNIAEGNGRISNRDYAHFLGIARGSLYETITQLRIARVLGYVSDLPEIESLSLEVGNMLGAMLKKFGAIQSAP